MMHQAIFDTSELCRSMGVNHYVHSPGSRNAPLTISFARNQGLKKFIIPDERSAAFIALGIAQATRNCVALGCTSGTAVLNYAPAVCEAFYRQIPLLIFSADRPAELIDQRDGQTIRQYGVLEPHVKGSFQMPEVSDESSAQVYQEKLKQAIRLANTLPKGPVHVNIPFREPFYPSRNKQLVFSSIPAFMPEAKPQFSDPIPSLDPEQTKVLILIGQMDPDAQLSQTLMNIADRVPVVTTALSNIKLEGKGISRADWYLNDQTELQPDILVTTGLSVLSKKLKLYLRKHQPKSHYHFDPAGTEVDTYFTNPVLIRRPLIEWLSKWEPANSSAAYRNKWMQQEQRVSDKWSIETVPFSEIKAVAHLFKVLPESCDLHLANSMPVRYADLLDFEQKDIQLFSNRGTSGIDGCTSTCWGHSLVSNRMQVLLTGDLAFFYDRNAFFNRHRPENLSIVVLNNKGGGIFRLIPGPSDLEELEIYFETRHGLDASGLCQEYGIPYLPIYSAEDLNSAAINLQDGGIQLIEIFTDPEINQEVFRSLRESYI